MQVKTNELTEQELIHVLSLPDLSWQTCGPIIEREKITITPLFSMEGCWRANHHNLRYDDMGGVHQRFRWHAGRPHTPHRCHALLCASRLGDEINIPEELK